MKKIGTDCSLDVCKAEGYLIMSYDARKKFSHDTNYQFIRYYPAYDDMYPGGILDVHCDTKCIWKRYIDDKEAIDSFADCNYNDINEIRNEYDLLIFADVVDMYNGVLVELS